MDCNVGRLIKNVNDKIKYRADSNLKKHNLTLSQSRVLSFLSSRGGISAQKEIELHLDITHPTVVGIISRMERSGYLISFVDEADRRNKIVKLTQKAVDVQSEIAQQIAHDEMQMLKTFSEKEILSLKRMLEAIYINIE